jgi:hypothetical protein
MHFNLRKALGISVVPLLGGALAIGAAASPASAQTWQDTALVAFHVVQPTASTTHGAMVQGVFSNGHTTLTFYAPRGQVFVPPATLTPPSGTFDFVLTPGSHQLVIATPTGSTKSGSATLTFIIGSANPAITYTATQKVTITETSGVLSVSSASSMPSETVAVSVFNNNATGTVTFTGTFGGTGSGPLAFSQSNLPVGLVSGNPLVPGTAFPRIYTGVIYTATDALGSTFSGTFSLHVIGHEVVPPPPPSNYGNEVNPFGNGFDVYQQHQAVNAIIAGWTATQADPATHFIRHPGTVPGAFTYEYAPFGAATGLSVSDPGYDAAGTGLTNGLVLRASNNGPWQQFIPQSDGTLRNVATGLIVSPNGTGAQLRGTTAPVPWGGSVYTWTDFAHLPA